MRLPLSKAGATAGSRFYSVISASKKRVWGHSGDTKVCSESGGPWGRGRRAQEGAALVVSLTFPIFKNKGKRAEADMAKCEHLLNLVVSTCVSYYFLYFSEYLKYCVIKIFYIKL